MNMGRETQTSQKENVVSTFYGSHVDPSERRRLVLMAAIADSVSCACLIPALYKENATIVDIDAGDSTALGKRI